jgi:uncharacterized protein (DUF2235 family)
MKRLVICFDGTWNRLDAQHSTNVVITAESVVPFARDQVAQVIFYDEGVGTGKWEHLRGGIFGIGLVQNLADAYRFLIFNYTPGDQIYIFGFSRGAFTARSFAGLLRNCSILRREHAGKIKEAISRYQERHKADPVYTERMLRFRGDFCPDVCVSTAENEWRTKCIVGYEAGNATFLSIAYLGVWDTVGALGIPKRYAPFKFISRKYEFHNTELSPFVRSARHAVAIDERRRDFSPTLWANIEELNKLAGADSSSRDAPYQQQWFPGVHGSVGGGGDRRGLSDQALDWVLDGARRLGLDLDAATGSRIFELAPDYREFIDSSSGKQSLLTRLLFLSSVDRLPGPQSLSEVSISARRRWHESPDNLSDKSPYRPRTLNGVAGELDKLDPKELGIGMTPPANFELHVVQKGETLGELALRFYGDRAKWRCIHEANMDKIEDPDRIYIGQSLRIPRGGEAHLA